MLSGEGELRGEETIFSAVGSGRSASSAVCSMPAVLEFVSSLTAASNTAFSLLGVAAVAALYPVDVSD